MADCCCVSDVRGGGCRIKIPISEFGQSVEIDPDRFLHDGWLTFSVCITIAGAPPEFVDRMPVFEGTKVSIDVVTDRRIAAFVKREGLSRMFHIPKSRMYILSARESLRTVKKLVTRRDRVRRQDSDVRCRFRKTPVRTRSSRRRGSARRRERGSSPSPSASTTWRRWISASAR